MELDKLIKEIDGNYVVIEKVIEYLKTLPYPSNINASKPYPSNTNTQPLINDQISWYFGKNQYDVNDPNKKEYKRQWENDITEIVFYEIDGGDINVRINIPELTIDTWYSDDVERNIITIINRYSNLYGLDLV